MHVPGTESDTGDTQKKSECLTLEAFSLFRKTKEIIVTWKAASALGSLSFPKCYETEEDVPWW